MEKILLFIYSISKCFAEQDEPSIQPYLLYSKKVSLNTSCPIIHKILLCLEQLFQYCDTFLRFKKDVIGAIASSKTLSPSRFWKYCLVWKIFDKITRFNITY